MRYCSRKHTWRNVSNYGNDMIHNNKEEGGETGGGGGGG